MNYCLVSPCPNSVKQMGLGPVLLRYADPVRNQLSLQCNLSPPWKWPSLAAWIRNNSQPVIPGECFPFRLRYQLADGSWVDIDKDEDIAPWITTSRREGLDMPVIVVTHGPDHARFLSRLAGWVGDAQTHRRRLVPEQRLDTWMHGNLLVLFDHTVTTAQVLLLRSQCSTSFYYHNLLPTIRDHPQPTQISIPAQPSLDVCLNQQPASAYAYANLVPGDVPRGAQPRQLFDVYSATLKWVEGQANGLLTTVHDFLHSNPPHNKRIGYLLVKNADLSFLWPVNTYAPQPTLRPLPDSPWKDATLIWNFVDAHVFPHSDKRSAWLLNLIGVRTIGLAKEWNPCVRPDPDTLPAWDCVGAWISVSLLPGQAVWIDCNRPHWVDIRCGSLAVCIDMQSLPNVPPLPPWFWELTCNVVSPLPKPKRQKQQKPAARQEGRSRAAFAPQRRGRGRREQVVVTGAATTPAGHVSRVMSGGQSSSAMTAQRGSGMCQRMRLQIRDRLTLPLQPV